jgi:hypothetical protein
MHIGQRKLFISELQFLTLKLPDLATEAYVVYAGAAPSCKMKLLIDLFPNVTFILVDPNEFYIYWNEYKKPHYTDRQGGQSRPSVVYLSYSDVNMYNSTNPAWNPKSINYYNPTTKTVEFVANKLGTATVAPARKNFKSTQIARTISGDATQESIDYILSSAGKHRIFCLEEYFTLGLANKLAKTFNGTNKLLYFWSDIRTNTSSDDHPDDLDIIWNNAMTYVC